MGIPVLMYHALDERPSAISITPETFKRQMQALHEGRFQVIPLGQLVHCLRTDMPLPKRSVVITFDDGFESAYTVAFPVLERYGFPATVFLVAGYCGKSNDWPSQPGGVPRMPLMTWHQAQEMQRYGIEFGAHTYSHPRLDQTPYAQLQRELVESRDVIQGKLGRAVDLFAYPYGRYDEASAALAGQTYRGACTTRLSMVKASSDPMGLGRVEALYLHHPKMVRLLSSPAMSVYLGIRRPVRKAASAVLRREWS
jgi:peptidoglycan/xylan/chitin deacetylase (PgdA/CDA1 family)